MELSDLHTLLVVSQERSFSRAALLLHRTQPAVSLAVRRLEQRVGTALFNRATKRPELTESGRLLVAYAEQICSVQAEAKTALARLRGLRGGEITVGVEDAYSGLLLSLLAAFRRHGQVRVNVVALDRPAALARVLRGDVDLAATELADPDDRFDAALLGRDRLVAVVAPSHPLARHAHATRSDLHNERIVGLGQCGDGDGHEGRTGYGGLPVCLTLPTVDSVKRAVEGGLGIAVLPASAVTAECSAGRLTSVTLADEPANRAVWLLRCARRSQPAAAAELFALARDRTAGVTSQEGTAARGRVRVA